MAQVPRGNLFIPDYTLNHLESLYKKEKDSKAKVRLQAAILRKKNKTLTAISDVVHYSFTTVGDWLRRLHTEGIDRRYSKKPTGRPAWLTKQQKKELGRILDKSPKEHGLPYSIWTTKLLLYFIDQKYNVTYKLRNVERMVNELGFSIKKARPQHRKANKKAQEAFKKKFKKKFNQEFTMDSRSFVLMKHISS